MSATTEPPQGPTPPQGPSSAEDPTPPSDDSRPTDDSRPVDDSTTGPDRRAKRKAVRSQERAERQRKAALRAEQAERQRLKELKERLPPKRERFTPVKRLRRRAVASEEPLRFGHHAAAGRNPDLPPPPTLPTSTFRLVCWNIEDGLDINGTLAGLTTHPNLSGAAVICLQEMDAVGVERVGAELGLNYVYLESSRDERTERGFGNAILSPHPLTEAQAVAMPHVAKAYGRPRAAVAATVHWPSADGVIPLSVWSVHAEIPSLSLSKRVAQYTAVAARAIAPNPDHLLVAGDFNTTTITSVVALDELYEMFDLGRLTAPAGPSLRRAGRLFYLDHVYGRGLDVEGAGVERDVIASDHWPLWVDVTPTASGRQLD
jgi:endonuclease/exonuclease/phosphatase family metal-dependent hydrolase